MPGGTDKRIHGLRMRTAGIWFGTLVADAVRIAEQNPGVSMDQSAPTPDITFDERLGLTVDGLRIELLAAVGETVDCCVVWLPEHRVARVSNLFGPLFPHFPNIHTIRGDRYRFVEPQLETNRMVRGLCPEVLVTGRHDPIVGADLIEASARTPPGRRRLRARPRSRGLQRRHRRLDTDAGHPAPARAARR